MYARLTPMKRRSPAAERNRGPLLDVLRGVLPTEAALGRRPQVLEIASGSGQHAIYFAEHLPGLDWQPSDVDAEARASVAAWRDEAGLPNLRAPIALDVTQPGWTAGLAADAIVCANMIHIAPWEACLGLLDGAAALLPDGGVLITYGPYRFDGALTAPSNEAFDASLRAQDPRWGVRDVADVSREAAARGLQREAVVAMPANNHTLIFRRAPR